MYDSPSATFPVIPSRSETPANSGALVVKAATENASPPVDFPATAPLPSVAEGTERFDAAVGATKGMAWPGAETQNRFFRLNNESLDQPAVTTTSGRQANVPVNDVDYVVRSQNLADLYQNSGLAAPKAAEPTPSSGSKPQEQGMIVYSANAAGYVDTTLKRDNKAIDQLAQGTGIQLYNSYSAPEQKPALTQIVTEEP